MPKYIYITGTGTGAGKTVLAALLTRYLLEHGRQAVAFKPVCSGGRGDALILRAALFNSLPLDTINPWHFRSALTPSLAAQLERCSVSKKQVLQHVRKHARQFEIALIEGAGGLLSPLGRQFDSRDLIQALQAVPIIVAPNTLGVVNHLRLTLEALPSPLKNKAKIVLMLPARPDSATASNPKLLSEYIPAQTIFSLPWLGDSVLPDSAIAGNVKVRRVLSRLASSF